LKRDIVGSIEAEYSRYRALCESALSQLDQSDLSRRGSSTDNSIATLVWHVSGNLKSRFTDFLESDGEKPWRDRESEFEAREVTVEEVRAKWDDGWRVLMKTMAGLSDEDLMRSVTIRGVPLPVHEALHRSLAHTAYHVGQVVYISKMLRSDSWSYLSIPPGGSQAYNRQPGLEKPTDHAVRLGRPDSGSA
jgi:Protein of unknown function (DUF1572)